MSIQHEARAAYGVTLDAVDIEHAMSVIGQDDSGSSEEQATCLAEHLGCVMTDVSNCWVRDGAAYIIGPAVQWNNEDATATVDQAGLGRLRAFVTEHFPDAPIVWVIGLFIY